MATGSVGTKNRLEKDSIVASTSCTGSCIYTQQDGHWTLQQSTCTGSCASQCPKTYDPEIAALLSDFLPDISSLSVSCASLATAAQIARRRVFKKVCLALAVCLVASLIVNAYLLFFR